MPHPAQRVGAGKEFHGGRDERIVLDRGRSAGHVFDDQFRRPAGVRTQDGNPHAHRLGRDQRKTLPQRWQQKRIGRLINRQRVAMPEQPHLVTQIARDDQLADCRLIRPVTGEQDL